MERPGNQAFADARFSCDEYRCIDGRQTFRQRNHILHGFASRYDPDRAVSGRSIVLDFRLAPAENLLSGDAAGGQKFRPEIPGTGCFCILVCCFRNVRDISGRRDDKSNIPCVSAFACSDPAAACHGDEDRGACREQSPSETVLMDDRDLTFLIQHSPRNRGCEDTRLFQIVHASSDDLIHLDAVYFFASVIAPLAYALRVIDKHRIRNAFENRQQLVQC